MGKPVPSIRWVLIVVCCLPLTCVAGDAIRIAFIDPLSGPFANVGEMEARAFQYSIDLLNARGGVLGGRKLELVKFDNKGNPQDSLLALRQAIDSDIRYITQGNGSAVASALVEGVSKQNERDPARTVLYLNYAAVDPVLTNDKCSFWHFRFDADADMKMVALTDTIAATKTVKKVYLINQDYSFGQAVSRSAKEMLTKKRPDISIVGDDLHPLGKIKDFSPYVAKIRASGADSVITGNWGNDFVLLVKAGKESGLRVDYYTYYAGSPGVLTTLGEGAIGRIKNVSTGYAHPYSDGLAKFLAGYRDRYNEDYIQFQHSLVIDMLAMAITRANSADPGKVALALEGMNHTSFHGAVHMRADNHQLLQPLHIASIAKVDGSNVRFERDHSGMGWKSEREIDAKSTSMATTCKMARPRM